MNFLECISMSNQEFKARLVTNANEPVFYPYTINVNKCSGSRNIINNPYVKLCIPDIVKNTNVKV